MSLFRLSPSDYTDAQWQREIDAIRDTIVERCRPLAIFIFGSTIAQARTAESDVDVAVIFETSEEAASAPSKILAGSPFRNVPVDLLVFGLREFLEAAAKGGIAHVIQETGRCIYGTPPWPKGET